MRHEPIQLIHLILVAFGIALLTACSSEPEPTSYVDLDPTATTLTEVPNAPERDWFDLAERYLGIVANPLSEQTLYANKPLGTTESFFVLDITEPTVDAVGARIQYVGERALWYTADDLDIDQSKIEATAKKFDELIFSSVFQTFAPLVEMPGKIVILNTRTPSLAGYFQSSNGLPKEVFPFSNERVMLVMNGTLDLRSDRYLGTLTHELQHLANWMVDPTEETWISEGLAELSAGLIGLPAFSHQVYLENPNVSLANWPEDIGSTASAYSGASLFSLYVAGRFGVENLDTLVAQTLDGSHGVQAYLDAVSGQLTFAELFADWLVANLGTASDSVFQYDQSPGNARIDKILGATDDAELAVHQLGGAYAHIIVDNDPVRITFDGATSTAVLPVLPHSGNHCWWSNRGDSIDSSLTREFDLTTLSSATLEFWSWYDIEQAFDHGYVAISVDAGNRWKTLEGSYTSSEDPTGSSLGHSYSGRTTHWQKDALDLTPYVGGSVLLRFNYVTDESINNSGWCIDDISVPELDYLDDIESASDWHAEGFLRPRNAKIHQTFVVRVVTNRGSNTQVQNIALDANNNATFTIDESAVLIVGGVTPKATLPGTFRITTSSL